LRAASGRSRHGITRRMVGLDSPRLRLLQHWPCGDQQCLLLRIRWYNLPRSDPDTQQHSLGHSKGSTESEPALTTHVKDIRTLISPHHLTDDARVRRIYSTAVDISPAFRWTQRLFGAIGHSTPPQAGRQRQVKCIGIGSRTPCAACTTIRYSFSSVNFLCKIRMRCQV